MSAAQSCRLSAFLNFVELVSYEAVSLTPKRLARSPGRGMDTVDGRCLVTLPTAPFCADESPLGPIETPLYADPRAVTV